MRISDWSSDVCSSDLATTGPPEVRSPRSSRTRGNSSQFSTPTADRDQTVSRRSEPSSRTTLIGEQTNPWDLLQPQDVMSRHRGAKQPRRYELLGVISLLSPARSEERRVGKVGVSK